MLLLSQKVMLIDFFVTNFFHGMLTCCLPRPTLHYLCPKIIVHKTKTHKKSVIITAYFLENHSFTLLTTSLSFVILSLIRWTVIMGRKEYLLFGCFTGLQSSPMQLQNKRGNFRFRKLRYWVAKLKLAVLIELFSRRHWMVYKMLNYNILILES